MRIVLSIVKGVLSFCSDGVLVFFVGLYSLGFLMALKVWIFDKEPFPKESLLHPIRGLIQSPAIRTLVLIAISLGLVGLVWKYEDNTRANHIIGDPFEEEFYEETYEAFIYINESPVFCLIDMERTDYGYRLKEIHLPYNCSHELDVEYFPGEHNEMSILCLYYDVDCDVVLTHPATKESQTILENTSFTTVADGEVCASLNSDTYHYLDCPAVKQINPSNLIYFEYEQEAYLLYLKSCEICAR